METLEHLEGSYGGAATEWGPSFPGPVEFFHTGAHAGLPVRAPVGDISDRIDWEIDGRPGLIDNYMYSRGVVSSDAVENFWLDGKQAVVRREFDNNYGPVGTSDHNMLLAMSYAQQVNQFYPNEQSQYDLIMGV